MAKQQILRSTNKLKIWQPKMNNIGLGFVCVCCWEIRDGWCDIPHASYPQIERKSASAKQFESQVTKDQKHNNIINVWCKFKDHCKCQIYLTLINKEVDIDTNSGATRRASCLLVPHDSLKNRDFVILPRLFAITILYLIFGYYFKGGTCGWRFSWISRKGFNHPSCCMFLSSWMMIFKYMYSRFTQNYLLM